MKKLFILFLFCGLTFISKAQPVQVADFSGSERQGSISASLNGMGYVGLGNNSASYFNDFFLYNPNDDSWIALEPFPGEGRRNAVAFTIGDYIYVGTGNKWDGGSINYADFYKYSPADDEWTVIAGFGGGERSSAVAFVIDGYAYVGTGSSPDGDKSDFWKYDPVEDVWTQVADAPGSRNSASGFSINGKGYLVAGITYSPSTIIYSDVQEYCPVENTWTERIYADGINLSFTGAASYVVNDIAYLAYGNKAFITSYNPQNNEVENLGDIFGFENNRDRPISFVIDGDIYLGLGSNVVWPDTYFYNDMWKYTPPLPEPEPLSLLGGGSYCEGTTPTGISAYIEGSETHVAYQLKKDGVNFGDAIEGNDGIISWDNLEAGTYIATGSNGEIEVDMNGSIVVEEVPLVEATVEISANELEVCQGQSVMVTAVFTNEGTTPVFKWFVNDVEQSEQSHVFEFEPSDNDQVICELTSNQTCIINSTVESNTLSFTTHELTEVSVEISAESLTVCEDDEIVISANVTNGGDNPTYIWTVNSVNQTEEGDVFSYIPADEDIVVCSVEADIACPAQFPAVSNELEITVESCTNITMITEQQLTVYPNPVKSDLTIVMPDNENILSISITGIDGRVVKNIDFNNLNDQEIISLQKLPSGVYMISVQGEKTTQTVKIIKE